MRVLLDESLPHDLAPLLVGHVVETVQGRGWAGMKNGLLLAEAAEHFDVFLTADRNLPHQQNLARFDVRVIVLARRATASTRSTRCCPACCRRSTRPGRERQLGSAERSGTAKAPR